MSFSAGHPPIQWASHARFVLALMLIALGCALLIASNDAQAKPADHSRHLEARAWAMSRASRARTFVRAHSFNW